jgi:hypothetical protein
MRMRRSNSDVPDFKSIVGQTNKWIGVDEVIGLNNLNKCMAYSPAAGNGWSGRQDSTNAALYRHSYLGHMPNRRFPARRTRLHLLMLDGKVLTDVLTHWRNASRLAEEVL